MKFAEARTKLIGDSRTGSAEDYALRRVEKRVKPRGTYNRKDVFEILCDAEGVPDFHVADHIHMHDDLETFARDLQMGPDQLARTRRVSGRLKAKMSEDDVCEIVVNYLGLM